MVKVLPEPVTPEQRHARFTIIQTLEQTLDRLRLITGRRELRFELESF